MTAAMLLPQLPACWELRARYTGRAHSDRDPSSAGRYFAIVNERGDLYLTWGKSDEGKKMMDAEQRYEVSKIIVQCVEGDADGDASNGVQQSFNLVLPRNTPVTAASKVRTGSASSNHRTHAVPAPCSLLPAPCSWNRPLRLSRERHLACERRLLSSPKKRRRPPRRSPRRVMSRSPNPSQRLRKGHRRKQVERVKTEMWLRWKSTRWMTIQQAFFSTSSSRGC
jgi:hypothetical protein